MEVLVTLVLISISSMLMFQMLGSYRLTRERVQAQSGMVDRQALFAAWLRASIQGLFIDQGLTFVGDEARFEGTTLNPLFAVPATPTLVRWEVRASATGTEVIYSEAGRERWRAQARWRSARFAFLDEEGKRHSAWPPRNGRQDELPSAILLLVPDSPTVDPTLAAAVLGPLKPVPRLTGEEEG